MKTYGWIFFTLAVISFIGIFTVDHDGPVIFATICGILAFGLLNIAYSYNYTSNNKNRKNGARKTN